MSVLKCWTGGMVMLLGLAGGLHAEMTVSQSNDPAAAIGMDLTALLGQDHAGLGAVEEGRLAAIVTPPVAEKKTRRKAGAPIAEVRRIFVDPAGAVIYVAEANYRGDYIHLEMDLLKSPR